jgi:hypothetical protein
MTRQFLDKIPLHHIKFYKNLSLVTRVLTCVQTDEQMARRADLFKSPSAMLQRLDLKAYLLLIRSAFQLSTN